jgi:hypothetical protein
MSAYIWITTASNVTPSGDKTWIHHCELEKKQKSMEWKHPQSPSYEKFKSQPPAGKVMFTIFWPCTGISLGEGQTINSSHYSEMFTDGLKNVI